MRSKYAWVWKDGTCDAASGFYKKTVLQEQREQSTVCYSDLACYAERSMTNSEARLENASHGALHEKHHQHAGISFVKTAVLGLVCFAKVSYSYKCITNFLSMRNKICNADFP
ncbi:unnamed protein product [Amoebophrya sp. A120]|nr:unnamed protein product [Amoebophrya sp. A120]CAD7975202.1 unnamed protein product [Amoebophrya sp. A120]|eukprot:GSA120T00000089001.1